MQLLFVFASTTQQQHCQSLAGMAQLSAAFGQQVSIWFEAPPSPNLIKDCHDAGIDNIYASTTQGSPAGVTQLDACAARQLIASSDRVVRL